MKTPKAKSNDVKQSTEKSRWLLIVLWTKKRLFEIHLTEAAGSISFTILLSMVPMLAIFLALFTQFPVFGTLKDTLENYFSQGMMPEKTTRIILKYLNKFASNAGKVSLIGGLALLVTAFTCLSAIEKAFNRIWDITDTRPWYKCLQLYLFLGTLGPLSIGGSLYVTSHILLAKHGVISHLPLIGGIASPIIAILWTSFTFSLLYRILPNRPVLWRDAFYGGIFASIAFEIAVRAFAFYMVNFNFYEKVYGTLAAFPIFIIWIYICSVIILLGAATAAILPEIRNGSWNTPVHPGKHFFDTLKVIGVLCHADPKKQYIPLSDIEKMSHLSGHEVEYSIKDLKRLGWIQSPEKISISTLISGKKIDTHWKWMGDLDQITLATVFEECVFTGNHQDILAKEIKRIIDGGLDISLSDYFKSPYAVIHNNNPQAFTIYRPWRR